MSQITSVEPQIKNQKRFNVFIDGKFAFGADEDLVVNQRLVVGKKLEQQDLEKLIFEAEVGKLMERMYGLFSIRARSEKEIRDYLKNLSFKRKVKGKEEIGEQAVELLIERLKRKGLINDLEFAKAWIESRRRSKQKGINALKTELYQKGIERETVDEVLQLRSGQVSEEDLAKLALEKKIKTWKNLEPKDLKRKALEYLMRKGFDCNLAKNVVEKFIENR